MARTGYTVQISANPSWAVLWIRLMRIAAHVIGPNRAYALAERWAPALVRLRIGDGKWQLMGRRDREVPE